MKKVFIMRGASGSGKSTEANRISERWACPVLSTDSYFIEDGIYRFDAAKLGEYHAANFRRFVAQIHNGYPAIVDNTNIKAWEFHNYIHIAHIFGFRTEVIEVDSGLSAGELALRNQHGVPEEIIQRQLDSFEDCSWLYDIFDCEVRKI